MSAWWLLLWPALIAAFVSGRIYVGYFAKPTVLPFIRSSWPPLLKHPLPDPHENALGDVVQTPPGLRGRRL